jgi:predicted Zn-dependent peptidase
MMWAGECLLFFDDWRDPNLAHSAIEDTTAGQVHQAAREIFAERRFASALIGPAESNTVMEKWRSAAV